MASHNVEINVRDGVDQWNQVYPITKVELVDGLDTLLASKVDKDGDKQLSEENFTTILATKLDGIAPGANNYIHPSTHPASIIVETTSKRFVSDEDKTNWNNKQDPLGFVPEDSSNKGKNNGYAGLDANGKIYLAHLPDESRGTTFFVASIAERDSLTGLIPTDRSYITDGEMKGNTYIWDGANWLLEADADWENINLDWGNIVNRPSSSQADIDDAVTKRHTHTNKTALDKIRDYGTKPEYDLGNMATLDDIADLGGGDMLKAIYDTNNNGQVDKADLADAVAWGGITGKPSSFPPSTHTHNASDIIESSTKGFVSDAERNTWGSKSKIYLGSDEAPSGVDVFFKII